MAQRAIMPPVQSRIWPGWVAWVGCLVLLIGAATYVVGPLARQRGWVNEGGSPLVDPAVIAAMHPDPEPLGAGVADPARTPTPAPASRARIGDVLAANPPELPGRYGGAVADLAGGALSHDMSADTAMIPASTLKVMLATAALDLLGPDTRFTTSVVSPSPGQLVLVGGGDPLLMSTPASYSAAGTIDLPSTADLAARTAEALRAQGLSEVSLGFDESLFGGANWHPTWAEDDRAFVAPVSALSVDEGAGSGMDSPAPFAARRFADQLREAGIGVVGDPQPTSGAGATTVAEVDSVPISLLVQELLLHSDNYLAEVLLRQIALASGQPATFEGGAAALTERLTGLGLWRDGQHIADGSGLSLDNRITPAALVAAIQLAASRDDLAPLLAGLPVACATGTLNNRFTDERSGAARGEVRAKTGTLNQVSGLVGYTPTVDGAVVAFAFIGNDLPSDQDGRPWFDHVTAALAGCRCAG